jgi:hypothetical protein
MNPGQQDGVINVYRVGRMRESAVPVFEMMSWRLTAMDDPRGIELPGEFGMVMFADGSFGQGRWRRSIYANGLFADLGPFIVPAVTDGLGTVTSWGDVKIPDDYYALPVRPEIEWMSAADWYAYRDAYRETIDPGMPELVPSEQTRILEPTRS